MKNLKFFLYKTKMLSKLKIEIFSLRYAKYVGNSERKILSLKFYEFIDVVCMNVGVLSNFLKNFWTQCYVLLKWLYNLCLPERLRACPKYQFRGAKVPRYL